jgi:hypothetical protein
MQLGVAFDRGGLKRRNVWDERDQRISKEFIDYIEYNI